MSISGGFKCILGFVLLSHIVGCASISTEQLKHSKLKPTKIQRSGNVDVATSASGNFDKSVGRNWAFALFPINAIYIDGDVGVQIMDSAEAALKAAGYNSAAKGTYNAADAGKLKIHVKDLSFDNHLYMPAIVGAGYRTPALIKLIIRLEDGNGALLWEGEVRSARTNYSWSWAGQRRRVKVSDTMNRLVKNMARVFSTKEFYRASQRVKRHREFIEDSSTVDQMNTDK